MTVELGCGGNGCREEGAVLIGCRDGCVSIPLGQSGHATPGITLISRREQSEKDFTLEPPTLGRSRDRGGCSAHQDTNPPY